MSPFPTVDRRRRGIALLITLAMLAIASIVLVAFVTSARVDRVATFSYSQSLKTDQLARGALQLVVAQLRQEMAKDAPPDTGGGLYPARPVYTNLAAANMAPQPSGTNSAMPLLLKASATNYPFAGLALTGSVTATAVSATAASLNGRSVPLSRWNQACLGTFPSAASAPSWVLVTRAGATNGAGIAFGATGATLNNPAASNTNCAVGRFAYAVYDVGGLLDVAVAGHPTSLTPAQVQRIKGTLAGADLSAVGIDADALVRWRNASNGASASAYAGYVTNFAATNGFLSVASGDTTFLGRQDLIAAAKAGAAGLSADALTNLTVFSRAVDAPSWGPATNAPAGGRYNYLSNAGLSNAAPFSAAAPNPNRLLPAVRFPAGATLTEYRNDGATAARTVQAGDPAVGRRFPLGRLAWITAAGPKAGISAQAIQACFGLAWGPSGDPNLPGVNVWKYVGPSGGSELASIETLDQVAAEAAKREPNFFELLQAGILAGSLAVDGGGSGAFASTVQKYPMLQILRIGASIIDQADADAMPTVIEFLPLAGAAVPWQAAGAESLPCLQSVVPVCGAPPESPTSTTKMAVYLLFSLWNPNQAAAAGAPAVRLRIQGGMAIHSNCGDASLPETIAGYPGYSYAIPAATALPLLPAASADYGDARLISAADVNGAVGTAASGWATTPAALNAYFKTYSVPASGYAAYRLPDLALDFPGAQARGVTTGSWTLHYSYPNPATAPFMAWMEYWNGTAWVPYQYFNGVNDPATWGGTASPPQSGTAMTGNPANAPPSWFGAANTVATIVGFFGGDPRSSRFGPFQFNPTYNTAPHAADSPMLWTGRDAAFTSSGYGGKSGGNGIQQPPSGLGGVFATYYFPATLARNNGTPGSTTLSAYADADGIQRQGDSGFWPSSTGNGSGNPFNLASTRTADRPQILDRPFASVAELGYVLRDDPWRSLDFSSANSADAALLDLFTVDDAPAGVAAGRISLNGRSAAPLAAVLSGAVIADPAGSPSGMTTIDPLNAASIASALVAATANGQALEGKARLVDRFVAGLATGFAGADDQYVKARREAVVRALADVGQARTWNLLVDLVAQAGQYPPTASSLSQFVVTGEKRYWLHVAIDRVTGEVVDSRLEAVTF